MDRQIDGETKRLTYRKTDSQIDRQARHRQAGRQKDRSTGKGQTHSQSYRQTDRFNNSSVRTNCSCAPYRLSSDATVGELVDVCGQGVLASSSRDNLLLETWVRFATLGSVEECGKRWPSQTNSVHAGARVLKYDVLLRQA